MRPATISFRTLSRHDFPMLLEWLQRNHVKRWWDNGHDTLEKISAHYSLNSEETKRFVAVVDGIDAGYFQYSRLGPSQMGTDQFLADSRMLSQGLGTRCLGALITLIVDREAPHAISVDPHPDNARAIRCYEKCGFNHDPTQSDTGKYFMVRGLKEEP